MAPAPSFIVGLDDIEARIDATAKLPIPQQGEALAALYQSTSHAEAATFIALMTGEVVHLRSILPRRPQPSPAAQGALSVPS